MRQRLLNDKTHNKYLFYALGEIALVVIGILLALQINNWNTNKQETKELHAYLKNIQNNLRADLLSLKEIRIFRDSSNAYSRNYLKIASKDEITTEDFNAIENSIYKVYHDNYFKPRKSGFETLKNSGFIGKLNGSKIEFNLNDYYYLIDKIMEREESLNNNLETLENVAYSQGIQIRMYEIANSTKKNRHYITTHQNEVKEIINNLSIKSANFRNSSNVTLRGYYLQSEVLAEDLIKDIDVFIEK